MMGSIYFNENVLAAGALVGRAIPVAQGQLTNVTLHARANRTGTGDLVGAFTVWASNDPRVVKDMHSRPPVIGGASETADWFQITSRANGIVAVNGSEVEMLIEVPTLGIDWLRFHFDGSGGTDGLVEAWVAGASG